MNSCVKGKVGEREAAELFRRCGVDAKRGQQHAGGPDSPDVQTGLTGIHVEVKRTESINVYKAYKQAERDAEFLEIPVVLHRRNRERWLAILDAETLITILKKHKELGML